MWKVLIAILLSSKLSTALVTVSHPMNKLICPQWNPSYLPKAENRMIKAFYADTSK